MKLFFEILLVILLLIALIVLEFTFIKKGKFHCNECKYTNFNVFRKHCKYCGKELSYHDNQRKKIAEKYFLIIPEEAANGVSEYCDKCEIIDSFDAYLYRIQVKLKCGKYEELQKEIEEILTTHEFENSIVPELIDDEDNI